MKWLFSFIAAICIILLAVTALADTVTAAGSVVKVLPKQGHGSGVHIGDGYILTAAHVVNAEASVDLLADDGSKQKAEVLWVNKAYDIALLKASKPRKLGVSELSCRTANPGEAIVAKGNPGSIEFVSTWGRVAGTVRTVGPWRAVLVTNIAVIPGQSGGPVYDRRGYVVGITVGVMVAPIGFSGSLVGVGYAVPGSAVCSLMARAA